MPRLRPQPPAPIPTPPPQPPALAVPLHLKAALTVPEAVTLSSIGKGTLYQLIAEGRIKVVRLGRAIVIPRLELDAFLAREAGAQAMAPVEVQLLRGLADARALTAAAKQTDTRLKALIAVSRAEREASAG